MCNNYFLLHLLHVGMAECPTLLDLMRFTTGGGTISIIEMIGTKYYELGMGLLQDHHGAKLDAIVRECRDNASDINRKILQKWVNGDGKQPASWATLATELELSGLSTLAMNIRKEKSK